MYNIIELEENVRVAPYLFKMDKEKAIEEVLKEKYKGKISKQLGIIVDVIEAKPKGTGIIIPGDAYVYYKTSFKIISFTVEVGEVFKGVVRDVVEFGAFVNIGPVEGLLHTSQIGKEKFLFDRKNKLLHNVKKDKTIKKGDVVYVKVSTVSLKGSIKDIKIGLTMRGVGLGKKEWLEEDKK